ncbi:Transmembrane 9 superfamily member 1 [Monoraphidium neglectum]|uniref:Transmembrane 9 superfamily member n=1 Tax=Monoraphidium neglectum TaxID=145388 RepID=A0A0D2KLB2_9CHLO|nr:Transmembrane 9 superfamily member 1 [Monoraphidium neglectum]KIY96548.1 Transmembrane 9 superfamily member 1 [Monoraphidium neglectum]|eukprot:XP_013895568.1 Transmembrane 9 superfamily member 1 [Monoraphidium neglectum]
MGGRQWVSNVLLCAGLLCGPLLAVFSVLNTVAWVQGSTQARGARAPLVLALPFGTICIIIVIWALVTFPLTVLGGIWGKNSRGEYNAPCRCGHLAGEKGWVLRDAVGFFASCMLLELPQHNPGLRVRFAAALTQMPDQALAPFF